MSDREQPALREEALEWPYVPNEEEKAQIARWLNELWERHENELPWDDSAPGPDS